jgi:two-component system NtrC family response regulator
MRPDVPAIHVLIVDDDHHVRRSCQQLLERAGYRVTAVATAAEARRLDDADEPGLVILELILPDGDGLSLLGELRALWPGLPAIVGTAYAEPRSIVEAMRRGAVDYLVKPLDGEELLSACRVATRQCGASGPAANAGVLPTIVGTSTAMARVRDTLLRLCRGRLAGALIVGEDGVGKTFLAQALHAGSGRRAAAPCLTFSCATGHAPAIALLGPAGDGASGLLAATQAGTVILDDVDGLTGDLQHRLLDRLERSPGPAPLVIGLTTEPNGASPLLGWLGRATVTVPPLRERTADVLPLAEHFLTRIAPSLGRRFNGVSQAAAADLLRHSWPGNVRELEQVVIHAARAAAGGAIQPEHLTLAPVAAGAPPVWAPMGQPRPLREITDAYIDHVLAVSGGNRTRAARILGVARETLRARMLTRRVAR